MVYVTRGLLEVLLDLASEEEPQSVNVVLGATRAGAFEPPLSFGDDVPVLTHFYFPEAGRSVRSVFGIDLGTPAGRGRARFVTHPQGRLELTRRDDLAGVVLIAVPPWSESSLGAFDRGGRRLDLDVVDVEPPRETVA